MVPHFINQSQVGDDVPMKEVDDESTCECRLIAAFVDGDIVRRRRLGIQRQNVDAERL